MNPICYPLACLLIVFLVITISIHVGESHENIIRWIIESEERDRQ